MIENRAYSLLHKDRGHVKENVISETSMHDLGMDNIIKKVSPKEAEQAYITRIMSHMSDSADEAGYRADIFEDICKNPDMRTHMMEILDRINFLKDYGSFKRDREEAASIWELMHRLEEIGDYITSVEALQECLSDADIHSEGLLGLRENIEAVYNDNAFEELKKDISECRASTSDLKSVTLGVNLNNRFEAESIGVVSLNNKPFTKSNVIGSFSDRITMKRGGVKDGNDWNGDYHYQPFTAEGISIAAAADSLGKTMAAASNPMARVTLATIPDSDSTSDMTRYMDRIVNHMMSMTVKKLKETLGKYVNITITNITDLIPEFMYYIRWAEYIDKLRSGGMNFAKANARSSTGPDGDNAGRAYMSAKGIYNLKLASAHIQDHEEIITNDLDFDCEHRVYILTGANRGGKTTITQAIGQLYVLAQGGIYIPGASFEYTPADCIYTHFPADEDKTMDLGRLGEECKRFRELYTQCSDRSLLLLNETFSTTSFEEGYFIAKDAVKAILAKGICTIYNTHMHKLAKDIDEINASVSTGDSAQSLIVRSDGGERSFRIEVAAPEGMSYAEDIARKYGVTYDMLME